MIYTILFFTLMVMVQCQSDAFDKRNLAVPSFFSSIKNKRSNRYSSSKKTTLFTSTEKTSSSSSESSSSDECVSYCYDINIIVTTKHGTYCDVQDEKEIGSVLNKAFIYHLNHAKGTHNSRSESLCPLSSHSSQRRRLGGRRATTERKHQKIISPPLKYFPKYGKEKQNEKYRKLGASHEYFFSYKRQTAYVCRYCDPRYGYKDDSRRRRRRLGEERNLFFLSDLSFEPPQELTAILEDYASDIVTLYLRGKINREYKDNCMFEMNPHVKIELTALPCNSLSNLQC